MIWLSDTTMNLYLMRSPFYFKLHRNQHNRMLMHILFMYPRSIYMKNILIEKEIDLEILTDLHV
jgi:hypothetical protein